VALCLGFTLKAAKREAAMADDDAPVRASQTAADLDPVRMIVHAEENLMGFRKNMILQAWETAVLASETADPADLDRLIRLHAGIRAIDFAMANKPSVYKMMAPI
jgi:hypothetical protein